MRLDIDKIALSSLLIVGASSPAFAQEAQQTSSESIDEASESVGEEGENAKEKKAKKKANKEKEEEKEKKAVVLVEPRPANDPTDGKSDTADIGYRVVLDPAPYVEDKPDMDASWATETMVMGTAPAVRKCLDKQYKGEPMETGTIVFERTINRKGRSIAKEVHDNDFGDELTDCLGGATRVRRYLRPKGPPYLDVFVSLKISSVNLEEAEEEAEEE